MTAMKTKKVIIRLCLFLALLVMFPAIAEDISVVQVSYSEVTNLTVADLEVNNGPNGKRYIFKGYLFVDSDNDWINNKQNKDGSVEDGAVYRKIAYMLEGYDMGMTRLTKFSDDLFGITTDDNDKLAPYVTRMSKYVVTGQALPAIMQEFSTLKSVEGTYDFDNWKFELTIVDVRECAKELEISENALGYVLAMLNEYGATINFEGVSCSVSVNPFSK